MHCPLGRAGVHGGAVLMAVGVAGGRWKGGERRGILAAAFGRSCHAGSAG